MLGKDGTGLSFVRSILLTYLISTGLLKAVEKMST